MWLSEFFLPTEGNAKTNLVVRPSQQPKILAKALRLARKLPTVRSFGYIPLYDDPTSGGAGLITSDGVKKPAYYAFKRG